MIGYRFTEKELLADFAADDTAKSRKEPWLTKARRLTRLLRQKPQKQVTSEWSEIKSIYTTRQHGKCAYCERLLGEHELSAVEIDVEHFRPKNAVKPWPTPELRKELKLPASFPDSPGKGKGYRLLAYHHLNYASACKTCNSRLKANYFPIAGKHEFTAASPAQLAAIEKPYLIFPLGDTDEDPEDFITFEGFMAVPRAAAGHDFNRGLVTIAFFRLNDERDDLLFLRAKQLDNLYTKLELLALTKSAARKAEIVADIEQYSAPNNDHAGCVRSLLRLYGPPGQSPGPASRKEALRFLGLARAYVRKKFKSVRTP